MKNHVCAYLFFLCIFPNTTYAQSANQALSNLTSPTAINQSLIPGTGTGSPYNLGSSSSNQQWKNMYFRDPSGSVILYYGTTAGSGANKFLHINGGTSTGGINPEGLFLGEFAGNLASGSNNGCVGIGYSALMSMSSGNHNTAVGWRALYNLNGMGGSPGDKNTMVGSRAGQRLSTGSGNTGVGYDVFYNKGDGTETQAYITGTGNTGIGGAVLTDADLFGVLGLLRGGAYNTVLGYGSGIKITTGNNNVLLGDNSGTSIDVGSDNIIIGSTAGTSLVGGNNNILVGIGVNASIASATDELNIGNTLYGNLSNNFIGIGSSALTSMFNVGTAAQFQISSSGKVVKYNNENTDGNGVPAILKVVDLSNQSATINNATLIASANVTGGLYRITFQGIVTQAASSTSSISIKILYTDGTSGASVEIPKNSIEDITKTITNIANSSSFTGTFLIKASASTDIKYKITYNSSGATSMQYAIRITAEKL